MRTKFKILIAVIVLVLAGGFVFYIYNSKKKVSINNPTTIEKPDEESKRGDNNKDESSTQAEQPANDTGSEVVPPEESADSADNSVSNPVDINDKGSADGKMLAHITTENCDTACKAYRDDLRLFEYCEQVCGISPIKEVKNCDGKKDIQKDYCLKDAAIGKENSTLCDNIEDVNIKKTCRNRILEEALEKRL